MATFGHTGTSGLSNDGFGANALFGCLFTLSEAATVESLSAHLNATGVSFKGVILNSSGEIVANGITVAGSVLSPAQFVTAAFGTPPELTAGNYFLAVVCNGSIDASYVASGQTQYEGNSYASPANWSDPDTLDYELAIYVTYTADGGASIGGALNVHVRKAL